MGNIYGKLNLAQMVHVPMTKKGKSGDMVEGIFIPIKKNNLFKSEKGNIYLDLIAFEVAPEKRKGEDTHLVKQSFSKDVRDKMSEQEQNDLPILGNLKVLEGFGEPAPNTAGPSVDAESDDDLPF